MPIEGLLLLKGLFRVYGDFTSGFRGDAFLGNILLELLCVVLISLKNTPLDFLSEERLIKWRGVMQNLMETKFNLSFLLKYLQSVAYALFQRRVTKDLDTEIATAEEALACAHKVLQGLKARK